MIPPENFYFFRRQLRVMPPKDKPSKKNALKKKDQAIEDRTFGLKNKNKSAKVQGFIQRKPGLVNDVLNLLIVD